jgi:hypothetical protein
MRHRQLRVYRPWEEMPPRPVRTFLSMNIVLHRSFWGTPLNGALLGLLAGVLVVGAGGRGSFQNLRWVLWQLAVLPTLMASEEFLHLLVFLHKDLPREALHLVVVYGVTAGGRKLICYGSALRFRGSLNPLDKIHISAPGPILSLFGASAMWAIILWKSASLLVVLQVLPITSYFLSALWPRGGVLPTDLANIRQAKKEGHYGLPATLGACVAGLGMIWVSFKQIVRGS